MLLPTRERRAAGKCMACGIRKARPDRTRCKRCAAQARDRQAEQKDARVAAGMCGICGKRKLVRKAGAVTCARCRVAQTENVYRMRRKRAANKLCIFCGLKVTKGSSCDACNTRERASGVAQRARLLKEGMCTLCGKRKPERRVGAKRCKPCRVMQTATVQRRRAALSKQGMCEACGKRKSRPNLKSCRACAGK